MLSRRAQRFEDLDDFPIERLRAVIGNCFPAGARVISLPRQVDAVFAISWRLLNDPQRRCKRSKTVRVTIDGDIVDKYAIVDRADWVIYDTLIVQSLADAMSRHDADHDADICEQPPVVLWHVSYE